MSPSALDHLVFRGDLLGVFRVAPVVQEPASILHLPEQPGKDHVFVEVGIHPEHQLGGPAGMENHLDGGDRYE